MDESEYRSQLEILAKGVDRSASSLAPEERLIVQDIAATGVPIHKWQLLKPLFAALMRHSVEELLHHDRDTVGAATSAPQTEDAEQRSRMHGLASISSRMEELEEILDEFAEAPFTIQRLAELLLHPRRHFSTANKFVNALERVLSVSSTLPVTAWYRREQVDRSTHPAYCTDKDEYKTNASGQRAFGAAAKIPLYVVDKAGRRSPSVGGPHSAQAYPGPSDNSATSTSTSPKWMLRFPTPSSGENSTVTSSEQVARAENPLRKAMDALSGEPTPDSPPSRISNNTFDDELSQWQSVKDDEHNLLHLPQWQPSGASPDSRDQGASTMLSSPPGLPDFPQVPTALQTATEMDAHHWIDVTEVMEGASRPSEMPASAGIPSAGAGEQQTQHNSIEKTESPSKNPRLATAAPLTGSRIIAETSGLKLLHMYNADSDEENSDESC